jgi:tetratricopeptide (TPR) repeat protein
VTLRQHLETQLEENLKLLKKLEDRLRFATDPKHQGQLKLEIDELKHQIRDCESELETYSEPEEYRVRPISYRPASKLDLGVFLETLKAFGMPLLILFSAIFSVYGCIQLFAQNNDGIITRISLSISIVLFLGICLYYARFWRPEQTDQGILSFDQSTVQNQQQKENQRKLTRRSAVAGLILIPLLSAAGFTHWQYLHSKTFLILVADFQSPDPQNKKVTTETIILNLRAALRNYPDVRVEALGEEIKVEQNQSVARKKGERQKAAIMIWGWYGKTASTVPFSTNFEVLKKPENLPDLGQAAHGHIRQVELLDPDKFLLQTDISKEMSYLSLFTLGFFRYIANDLDGAINSFNDALSHMESLNIVAVNKDNINKNMTYFYQGNCYYRKNDYKEAIENYDKAIQNSYQGLVSNDTDNSIKTRTHFNRGNSYRALEKHDLAIKDYTQALETKDNNIKIKSLLNRGSSYFALKTQNNEFLAIQDFEEAVKSRPNHDDAADAHYNLGTIYYISDFHKNYKLAISEYTETIFHRPNDVEAYYYQGLAYLSNGNEHQAIQSFEKVIQLTQNAQDGDLKKLHNDANQELQQLNPSTKSI